MIHECQTDKITVVQLGNLETSMVESAMYRASQLQNSFQFWFEREWRLPLEDKYKLANGGYDLCGATKSLLSSRKYKKLPRPLLLVSQEPMGDPDNPDEPEDFWDYSQEDDYDRYVSIISTYTRRRLPRDITIESYMLMMLATYVFSVHGNLSFHEELRECVFDMCNEYEEVTNCFRAGRLCEECEAALNRRMRGKGITVEKAAAATKLLNKSAGRKYCFVVMPFAEKFNQVYGMIFSVMSDLGWTVKRADEVTYPTLITELIFKEIMTSDLVIADLTDLNPNVLYEVGLTHAVGDNLILMTQGENPFDLKNEQTIIYDMNRPEAFRASLQRKVASGSAR